MTNYWKQMGRVLMYPCSRYPVTVRDKLQQCERGHLHTRTFSDPWTRRWKREIDEVSHPKGSFVHGALRDWFLGRPANVDGDGPPPPSSSHLLLFAKEMHARRLDCLDSQQSPLLAEAYESSCVDPLTHIVFFALFLNVIGSHLGACLVEERELVNWGCGGRAGFSTRRRASVEWRMDPMGGIERLIKAAKSSGSLNLSNRGLA